MNNYSHFAQLERKRGDEKSERDRLNDVYLELVEKQRAYYKRVKEFQDVSICHIHFVLIPTHIKIIVTSAQSVVKL